ncbi:MAG: AbrB/MazE/SpoVT family DNA-binding domain-containing protein [Solirubrobacteraceae bacterium]
MRATIDQAGRVVIPKQLRDELGFRPGEVELTADGNVLRVEPVTGERIAERNGRLVIPAEGAAIDDAFVRAARDAGRR